MGGSSIVLRLANPAFDEGLACGRYLDEAAEGFFRIMLGREAARIIARSFARKNHSYSFENVIFAEHDDDIVGMALGFTAEQHRRFSDRPLREAAGYRALRMTVVMGLCAPLMRVLNTLREGDFYILSMAVDKEHRGQGIGSMLMDSMEARARAGGASRLALDVAAGNKGARRLYERRGMTVASQWPRRLVIPGLRLFRMTKKLQAIK